jgi:predicted Zn-dependent protease
MSTSSRLAIAVPAVLLGIAALALPTDPAGAAVPYTGRKQIILVPDAVMNMIGKSSYQGVLDESQTEKQGQDVTVLKKVGGHISKAAKEPDFAWRYAMIEDQQVNAWCLPGGYIGFYSGILPVLQNEAGMAFVMGHEVGHAIARHGSERMTENLAVMGGLLGLNAYLSGESKLTPEQRNILMGAIGLGVTYGVSMPFSRMQESEADVIGEMLMANAGYPPGQSIEIWDRMEKLSPSGPSFLSDHPSNSSRQENLRDWLPRAKKRYERARLDYDTTEPIWGGGSRVATGDGNRPGNGSSGSSPSGGTSPSGGHN